MTDNTNSGVPLDNRIKVAIAQALEKDETVNNALVLVIEQNTGAVVEAHIVTEDDFLVLAYQYKKVLVD